MLLLYNLSNLLVCLLPRSRCGWIEHGLHKTTPLRKMVPIHSICLKNLILLDQNLINLIFSCLRKYDLNLCLMWYPKVYSYFQHLFLIREMCLFRFQGMIDGNFQGNKRWLKLIYHLQWLKYFREWNRAKQVDFVIQEDISRRAFLESF